MRRRALLAAEPNEAHRALARLQQELDARGDTLFLCTQNVDDLHERAGSTDVVHMHGQLLQARCTRCRAVSEWRADMGTAVACPACAGTGGLRPDVVWFGERPMHMPTIEEELASADLFVAVGTSGSVYPAAGFVGQAWERRISRCEINLVPSDNARLFDSCRYGPATQAVPAWVDDILVLLHRGFDRLIATATLDPTAPGRSAGKRMSPSASRFRGRSRRPRTGGQTRPGCAPGRRAGPASPCQDGP